jgi:hypothetical protein
MQRTEVYLTKVLRKYSSCTCTCTTYGSTFESTKVSYFRKCMQFIYLTYVGLQYDSCQLLWITTFIAKILKTNKCSVERTVSYNSPVFGYSTRSLFFYHILYFKTRSAWSIHGSFDAKNAPISHFVTHSVDDRELVDKLYFRTKYYYESTFVRCFLRELKNIF